jgi:hypothetical protein
MDAVQHVKLRIDRSQARSAPIRMPTASDSSSARDRTRSTNAQPLRVTA